MREFGRTHLQCPECEHYDCFSEFAGSEGQEGYCFSCGKTILKPGKSIYSMPLSRKKPQPHRKQQIHNKTLAFGEIGDSIQFLSEENYEFGERAGIMLDSGYTLQEADRMAREELALTKEDICKIEAEDCRKRGNIFGAWLIQMTCDYDVLRKFNVGFNNGNTIFWYQNIRGEFVNGKAIKYMSDGHRDKNISPRWLYKKSDGFATCLFNEEELVYRRSDSVVLVESEKSAILGSYYMPEVIWIATGGSNGLTKLKARVLRDRQIWILFDYDTGGKEGSSSAKKILYDAGGFPKIVEPKELFGEDIQQGFDIADHIVGRRQSYAGQ